MTHHFIDLCHIGTKISLILYLSSESWFKLNFIETPQRDNSLISDLVELTVIYTWTEIMFSCSGGLASAPPNKKTKKEKNVTGGGDVLQTPNYPTLFG